MQKEEESKGQNVKVVLRCRPMTKSEASQEKQSLRCTSDKTVDVMYGKAGKKSFTFDGTFDESTSQKDMYDNVVRPVVDEVLQGYNCTVFAYGQTGTGKTYTMEGGIDKASGTTIPPSAGVVPRAVAQVFKHLEENEVEYQVRISVVELYNEELSDLIASSDTEAGMLRKLRLLEDPKKGVVLQGVEERPVTCAADIFSILECTNRQRKTAETLCNKQSSRSHSIFTLKIFMKEKMVDEEEIIKTGLLNLVDLAGSECVGRSGAQGDRKKEAGQINQSLLTLGRVITSLVERHVHVPYRESKLTRLLQESLGGRTKTIIIATVSPNSANIEETLSTLDYASRAKAIKNTPQINQVQTKKAMMRELAGSIADLQEQLRAQRDGTGVYLPTAKYEGMQTEMSRLRDMELAVQQELDEKQKLYDELSANFTETCETLADTRGTLALTEGTLRETEETLGATQVALKDTEVTLENTTAVLDEHKEVGDKLYGEGSSLLEESEVMREEIGGLFSKIDRKAKVLDENEKIAREHQSSLAQQVMAAAEHLDAFRTTQASNFLSLQRVVAEFVVEKNSEIDTLKRTVASLQESASAAMDKQGEHVRGSTAEGIISLQATGKLAADQRDAEVALVQAGVAAMGAANAQVMSSLAAAKSGVTEWAEKALSGIDADECIVSEFASKHKQDLFVLRLAAEAAAKTQADAVAKERAALASFVAAREGAFAEMRARVQEEVGQVLERALAEQQAQIVERMGGVMGRLAEHQAGIEGAAQAMSTAVEASTENTQELKVMVVGRAVRAKKDTEERRNLVSGVASVCSSTASEAMTALTAKEAALLAAASTHTATLASAVTAAVDEQHDLCAAAEEGLETARVAQAATSSNILAKLTGVAGSAQTRVAGADSALEAQGKAVAVHCKEAAGQLAAIRATEMLLAGDVATGATPLKREITLPGALPNFRADASVIASYRGISSPLAKTPTSSIDEAFEAPFPKLSTLSSDDLGNATPRKGKATPSKTKATPSKSKATPSKYAAGMEKRAAQQDEISGSPDAASSSGTSSRAASSAPSPPEPPADAPTMTQETPTNLSRPSSVHSVRPEVPSSARGERPASARAGSVVHPEP